MHNSFGHTPFASMPDVWKTTQNAQSPQPSKKAPQKSKVVPKKNPLAPPLAEDDALFLDAMGSLVSTQKGSEFIQKGQKGQKGKKNMSTMAGVFALQDAESFAKLLPQEKLKSPQKTSFTPPSLTQEEALPTMQELLNEEKAASMGHDAEAQDAFFKAMKEVSPLSAKGRDIAPEVRPAVPAQQGQDAFALMLEKKLEFSLALKGEYIEGHVLGLDELTMNNLRAGVYSPEAHLDLHGLNAMQAYTAMVGFFKSSWYKGMRTLLLIPGRGKNSPNGVSVLREKVQLWLTQEPFKRVVLAFCTAQPVDGGPGTIYVLVRKYKKKGKICWERLPSDPDLY